MTFLEAKDLMREGLLMTTAYYRAQGIFFFMRPGADLDPLFIVNEVKTLPPSFKETLKNRTLQSGAKIHFTEYICMRTERGSVLQGWQPSGFDKTSKDWEEYRPQ